MKIVEQKVRGSYHHVLVIERWQDTRFYTLTSKMIIEFVFVCRGYGIEEVIAPEHVYKRLPYDLKKVVKIDK